MNLNTITNATKKISDVEPQAYDDILHPAAHNVGTALGTVTDLVNTLLTPFELINKTVAIKKKKFLEEYEQKLNQIPIEKQCTPRLEIAAPIIEHAKYKITEVTLREKYVQLLSAASNSDNQAKPLLSFENVLNQLSPYEINLLTQLFKDSLDDYFPLASIVVNSGERTFQTRYKNLTDISFKNLSEDIISVMISNFERLGLIAIDHLYILHPEEEHYSYVDKFPLFLSLKKDCESERHETREKYPTCTSEHYCFSVTEFGKSFIKTVIL